MSNGTLDTLTAINILLEQFSRLAAFARAIRAAEAEGRNLTPDEVDEFRRSDDDARNRLEAAIRSAGG